MMLHLSKNRLILPKNLAYDCAECQLRRCGIIINALGGRVNLGKLSGTYRLTYEKGALIAAAIYTYGYMMWNHCHDTSPDLWVVKWGNNKDGFKTAPGFVTTYPTTVYESAAAAEAASVGLYVERTFSGEEDVLIYYADDNYSDNPKNIYIQYSLIKVEEIAMLAAGQCSACGTEFVGTKCPACGQCGSC